MNSITYYNHIDRGDQEQLKEEILSALMNGEQFELLVDDGDGDVWRYRILPSHGELMEG